MSQKLLVNKFEWIEDTSQFNGDFIKNYNEESDEGKLMFTILKNYTNFIMICHFSLKELTLKKLKRLLLIYSIKLHVLFTWEI